MAEIKSFTRETLDDAKSIVERVFSKDACAILDTALNNPALKDVPNADAGFVAYIDGKPVAFDATILRKMYYKQTPFWGMVGSTVGVLPEARKEMVAFELMKMSTEQRFGSKIFFGNSANKNGMRINKAFGMKNRAPQSCAEKRIAVIRRVGFFFYLIKTKLFKWKFSIGDVNGYANNRETAIKIGVYTVKRLFKFTSELFDGLWTKYLSTNCGLVCSRTAEELNWLFGDRLSNRRCVLAGLFQDEELVGYVVYGLSGDGARCQVLDFLTINNNGDAISVLLAGGLKILRSCTHIVMCTISGFPEYAQRYIVKTFKMRRLLENNQFAWKIYSKDNFPDYSLMSSPSSWFFGPYDGDNCIV